jgi:hypothetical protein
MYQPIKPDLTVSTGTGKKKTLPVTTLEYDSCFYSF